MEKKKNYTNLILIGLAILAAFLAGSAWTKIKNEQGVSSSKPNTAEVQPSEAVAAAQTFSASKSAKPVVKFFVMSFCPYGNQAEEGLKPVYDLLKDKVDWQPRYIVSDKKAACETSCPYRVFNDEAKQKCQTAIDQKQLKDMVECQQYYPYQSKEDCLEKACANLKAGEWESLHGDQELRQDVREICAFKLGDLNKWWQFVDLVNKNCSSQNADSCWKNQAKSAGLAASQISQCLNSQQTTLLTQELAEADKYQAQGSPTVYINEVLYPGGRAPEDYKQAICSSFTEAPKECETALGTTSSGAQGGCN